MLGLGRLGCVDDRIAIGGDRVVGRRWRFCRRCRWRSCGQYRPDFLDKGPQVSLGVRMLLQQVRQPIRPPYRQSLAEEPDIRPGRTDELLACLPQPLLG